MDVYDPRYDLNGKDGNKNTTGRGFSRSFRADVVMRWMWVQFGTRA